MTNNRTFAIITLGVVVWGAVLAVGSYYGGEHLRHDVRRGAIVITCVVAFLAFWWTMLAARKRRLARENEEIGR